jgi:hypothetical protein
VSRLTLHELRHALLFECRELLGLGGSDWYRLTTALERLVVDGHAEIKTPGSTVRRFRLREAA